MRKNKSVSQSMAQIKALISKVAVGNKPTVVNEYNQFDGYVYHESFSNPAIFKIFSDYFENINQNDELSKNDKIKIVAFLGTQELISTGLNLGNIGTKRILVDYNYGEKDVIRILFYFDVYRDSQNRMNYFLLITSGDKTKLNSSEIYQRSLNCALSASNVKGKHLVMYDDELAWDVEELTKRSFKDIYLPNKVSNDLYLYKKVFMEQNHLMRYLLLGIPGTGKTESALVLSNEMMNQGVTIIKTSICEALKEKIALAELLAPSLIIFDDIDLSLGSRNRGGISPLLRSFLDVLDGTQKINANVGILATTNSLELLDIAARRPGRFDKTIIFDKINQDNIRDIIKKSLKVNFMITDVIEPFIDKQILELYYDKGLTGSHIYNSTEILFRKALIEFSNLTDITIEWVISNVKDELEIITQMKEYNSEITDTYTKSKKNNLGFLGDNDGVDEDFDDEKYRDNEVRRDVEEGYPSIEESPTRRKR